MEKILQQLREVKVFQTTKRKNLMFYSLRFEAYIFASYMHPHQVFRLFRYGL
jgi:hypothetical protein